MGRYLLRRLLYLAPVWLGVSIIAFGLANLAPGDPARLMLQNQLGLQPTPEEVARARDELGLDDPIIVRYARWLGSALTGDLGTSYRNGESVLGGLVERFPRTLQIAVLSMVFTVVFALPLGVVSAVHRNSPLDHMTRVLALLGAAIPSYVVAYVLILVFAVKLHLLPVAGRGSWQHLILPSVTLALAAMASMMRLTRSEMLDVLGQDYVRTSRAKGLSDRAVYLRHAFRNALIPVVTIAGLRFAGLLGGAVIVEMIFAWPGIGMFMLDAIFARDYPVIQGFVIFMGTVFILVNLVIDISYAWLDPRIRYAGT